MHTADILSVLQWWIVWFVIGLVFIPFTTSFFSQYFDRGYIFSKILGAIIVSYAVFVLGILHILPFSQLDAWFVIILAFLILHLRLRGNPAKLVIKTDIFQLISKRWKIILWEELIFLSGLFFWSYIRAFNPDIHGLEKYMDFGFVNSILRSTYFPPKDMWFTPFVINYYYFGHLLTAVITKLSGVPSYITFNLMIATLFALSFSAAYSIGSHLAFFVKKQIMDKAVIASGLLSAFLVTLGGNLHILYSFFSAYPNDSPVPLWQLKYQPQLFPNSYWYPNATRFIYHTIHEFPIYSWVVSDLHGHVLDIPIVLTTIAVLLSLLFKSQTIKTIQNKKINSKKTSPVSHSNIVRSNLSEIQNFGFGYLLLIGFLISVMYMTNAWDGAIYLLLTTFVFFYIGFKNKNSFKNVLQSNNWIIGLFAYIFIIFIIYIIFTLPYSIFFKPFVSGIGVICAPQFLTKIGHIGPFLFEPSHCDQSPWWQLLILYGFFLFFILSFLFFLFKKGFSFFHRDESNDRTDAFVFCLMLLSIFLIILPEFIYVKDIYPTYYRANTMFKLVFQAFMMLSLSSGYVLLRFAGWFRQALSQKIKLPIISLGIWLFIALWLCGLVGLYPYLAINSYYNNLTTYHGLDGITYLQTSYPTDYDAILWINKHIQGQPVILEAQGDSYTDYARVSANTGLPTVLGWTVHEWLWRGSYDVPAPRITEVQNMYESTDLNATKQLLQKYHVQYVFIGTLEKQKYPTLDESKFKQLGGKIVYQNGQTKIYQLPANI